MEGDVRLGASVRAYSRLGRLITLGRFSALNAELYALVRSKSPDVIVETGVASGVSSTLILAALSRNRTGHLYSIDKPNWDEGGYIDADGNLDRVTTPKALGPGWLVPAELRDRWTLIQGTSREFLPNLLEQLKHVEFFFHDSEHSYTNMYFEFEEAARFIRSGGVLYSDDIFANTAFADFATSHSSEFAGGVSPVGRGALVKK